MWGKVEKKTEFSTVHNAEAQAAVPPTSGPVNASSTRLTIPAGFVLHWTSWTRSFDKRNFFFFWASHTNVEWNFLRIARDRSLRKVTKQEVLRNPCNLQCAAGISARSIPIVKRNFRALENVQSRICILWLSNGHKKISIRLVFQGEVSIYIETLVEPTNRVACKALRPFDKGIFMVT